MAAPWSPMGPTLCWNFHWMEPEDAKIRLHRGFRLDLVIGPGRVVCIGFVLVLVFEHVEPCAASADQDNVLHQDDGFPLRITDSCLLIKRFLQGSYFLLIRRYLKTLPRDFSL